MDVEAYLSVSLSKLDVFFLSWVLGLWLAVRISNQNYQNYPIKINGVTGKKTDPQTKSKKKVKFSKAGIFLFFFFFFFLCSSRDSR